MHQFDEEMRRTVTWALLRLVWQTFDSGGESMRSRRSVSLELGMSLIRPREDLVDAVIRLYEEDPDQFIQLARECQSADFATGMVTQDRAEGIQPMEIALQAVELGKMSQQRMADMIGQKQRKRGPRAMKRMCADELKEAVRRLVEETNTDKFVAASAMHALSIEFDPENEGQFDGEGPDSDEDQSGA